MTPLSEADAKHQPEAGSTTVTFPTEGGGTGGTGGTGGDNTVSKPVLHVEVVQLSPHYALPPGCELQAGVTVVRKPYTPITL
jgi:hypothetical protein